MHKYSAYPFSKASRNDASVVVTLSEAALLSGKILRIKERVSITEPSSLVQMLGVAVQHKNSCHA